MRRRGGLTFSRHSRLISFLSPNVVLVMFPVGVVVVVVVVVVAVVFSRMECCCDSFGSSPQTGGKNKPTRFRTVVDRGNDRKPPFTLAWFPYLYQYCIFETSIGVSTHRSCPIFCPVRFHFTPELKSCRTYHITSERPFHLRLLEKSLGSGGENTTSIQSTAPPSHHTPP